MGAGGLFRPVYKLDFKARLYLRLSDPVVRAQTNVELGRVGEQAGAPGYRQAALICGNYFQGIALA